MPETFMYLETDRFSFLFLTFREDYLGLLAYSLNRTRQLIHIMAVIAALNYEVSEIRPSLMKI